MEPRTENKNLSLEKLFCNVGSVKRFIQMIILAILSENTVCLLYIYTFPIASLDFLSNGLIWVPKTNCKIPRFLGLKFGVVPWKNLYTGTVWLQLSPPVLYCTVLNCTVLYCTVLYCTVLYCTVLYCTVLYCTVLYCTVLYCIRITQLEIEWSGNIVSVLGREEGYTVKYTAWRARTKGTPEGKGVYLTIYPESSPNTGSISFVQW